ncbi:MAG: 2-oxoacid:acceptor oxidoreductase family protein, partial [Oscillospiraceae bacterium]
PAYIGKYNMIQDLKDGGTFLLNCAWDMAALEEHLPAKDKKYIAEHNISLYVIDAIAIDKKLGLRGKYNTVLQSAFFKLANIIPETQAIEYMKAAATKSYARKGDDIVKMNHDAIDAGVDATVKIEIPSSWKNAEGDHAAVAKATGSRKDLVNFVNDILIPTSLQQGDALPVSTFKGYEDGHMPQGSAAYEKRGIAVNVPTWNTENCIQCNFCSYVCPHAVIRPVAMTADELAKAPAGTKSVDMTGMPGMKMVMTVSIMDCTGCGSCVNVCPGKKGEKALSMKPLDTQAAEQAIFEYGLTIDSKAEVSAKFNEKTVKGRQFNQTLLEFSGACGGCGETPYAKLITQLFGERLYLAPATGCSSRGGGSAPAPPSTV